MSWQPLVGALALLVQLAVILAIFIRMGRVLQRQDHLVEETSDIKRDYVRKDVYTSEQGALERRVGQLEKKSDRKT